MFHAHNDKFEKQTAEGIELQNQKIIRTHGDTEKSKYLGILEAVTMKQAGMKQKIRKVPQMKKKASRNQLLLQKSLQRD